MSLIRWLQKTVSKSSRKPARHEGPLPRSRRQRYPLCLERLEARLTPSTDIIISDASPAAGGAFALVGGTEVFTATAPTATVLHTDIETFLNAGTSVTINTASAFGNPGDISEAGVATIHKASGGSATLTLNANHNIHVSQAIDSVTGQLAVALNAAAGNTVSAGITTNGGAFSSTGAAFDNTGGAIVTAGGNITITATGGVTIGAGLSSSNGAISVTGLGISQPAVTVNAGAGTIAYSSVSGAISIAGTLATTNATAAAVVIHSATTLDVGSVTAASGTLVVSATSVVQTAGTALSVSTLIASSVGGISLPITTNAVGTFNATNSGAGAVQLVDSSATLTVTGITNTTAGGSVSLDNTGAISITGAVNAGGNIVTLIAGGAISESGTGLVNTTGSLGTRSTHGTTLSGANSVGDFSATNFTSGAISLTNTAASLSIAGISQSGGGNVAVSNAGAIAIFGAIETDGGNITLTSTGTLSQSSEGFVSTPGTLTTISSGGTILNLGNDVGAFNATNTTSGNVSLTNTASPLTITGISESGGGNIVINNTGAIVTSGVISTNPTGDVMLTATALSATASLTVGAPIDASGAAGTVNLNASSVSETTGGVINAINLLVLGSGTFSLAQPNSIRTLAAHVGALTFNNVGTLVLDAVLTTTGIAATGPVTINTGGNLTVLQAVATAGAVTLQGNGAILINAAVTGASAMILGGVGNDTITVNVSGATPLTLDGLGGNNQYVVQIASLGSPLTISDSGGGSSSATINGPLGVANENWLVTATTVTRTGSPVVTFTGLTSVTVNASGGHDTITVNGTHPVTDINVGGGGNDLIVSSPTGLLSTVTGALNLRVGGSGNKLDVSEAGATARDVVFLNASRIVSNLGTFAPITYQATGATGGGDFAGGVLFQTGQGNNSVNVQGTLANVTTTVQGGAGNDFFLVTSDPSGTGTLAAISGPLVLDAGAGANALEVSEAAATTGDTVFMTNALIYSNAVGGFKAISYQAAMGTFAGGVSLFTGSGNDTVGVQSTRADGNTHINTGAGDDFVLVSSDPSGNGNLAGIAAPLILDEGAGNNRLEVSEAAATTSDTVFVTGALIYSNNVGGFKVISYQATGGSLAGGIALFTGQGDDTVCVLSTRPEPTAVDTGAGNDLVIVSSDPNAQGNLAGLAGPLHLATGTGTNRLFVSDKLNAGPLLYSILTNASIERADGVAPIIYGTGGTFAQVLLVTGRGGGSLNVRSTLAAAASTIIQTGIGDNHFVVSTTPDGKGGVLDFLKGRLELDGFSGRGTNHLVVSEAGSTTADTVSFTNGSITSSGGVFAPISYFGNFIGSQPQTTSIGTLVAGDVALLLGQADNLDFESKLPFTPTYIRMGTGPAGNAANISVFSNSAYTGLTIDLVTGANPLNVNDRSGGGQPFIVPGPIANTGKYMVVYSGSTSEIDFIGTTFQPLF